MNYFPVLLMLLATLAAEVVFADPSNVVYFVFAEAPAPRGRDAFVLPLTRSNDIAFVRSWLRDGDPPQGTPTTPVFWIACGSDGINRDYLTAGAPQWSWHVVEFVGFAAGVSGHIGSSATYIEGHLDEWMANTRGLTALFHVPLFELLPRADPAVSATLGQEGLHLSWTDLGVHYVYTVEIAARLDSPQWTPAPGAVWPMNATHWVDSTTAATQTRYYRVRAQLRNP